MQRKESIKAKSATYVCSFKPEPEGGYTVTCPSVPGMVTYGQSLDEARVHAQEAIELCLEVMRAQGQKLPPSDQPPKAFKALVGIKTAV